MKDSHTIPKRTDEPFNPAGGDPWFSSFSSPSGFVSPSLNQVRIVDFRGSDLPPGVSGHTGYELLSAAALRQLVRGHALSLSLDEKAGDLLERFDDCFTSTDPGDRAAAELVAAEFGKRLGFLLLTLHRADEVNRLARPDWTDGHWAFWQAIRQVWLAGGLMSGRLGSAALHHTRLVLQRYRAQMKVELAAHPALLPLLGAARHGLNTDQSQAGHGGPLSARVGAPNGNQPVLVFDFGQTMVKRALAHYRGGCLVKLVLLPVRPSDCGRLAIGSNALESLEQQVDAILNLVVESWLVAEACGLRPETHAVISLATYLFRGQPCQPQDSCYGRLAYLSSDLPAYLATCLSKRLGRRFRFSLLHDGSAAASVYAGRPDAAVIVLGTAMGVGFPNVSEDGLCPVAADLVVANLSEANESRA
jgi:hypothetical protein